MAQPDPPPPIVRTAPVSSVVVMLPVSDVERSAAFYAHLGFRVGNRVPRTGAMHWAWLFSPTASDWRLGPNLMLSRGNGVPDAQAHPVVLYLYAGQLAALRDQLVAAGLEPGPIEFPDYLPLGECFLKDPDGHHIYLAQSFDDTP